MVSQTTHIMATNEVVLQSGVSSFGMSGTNAHAVLASGVSKLEVAVKGDSAIVKYQHTSFAWWLDQQPATIQIDTLQEHIYQISWQSYEAGQRILLQTFGGASDLVSISKLSQFTVSVLGAGATGIGIAGILSRHGISCVLLDKRETVGGLWNDGYAGLKLHTPTYYYQFLDAELENEQIAEQLLESKRSSQQQLEYFEDRACRRRLLFVPGVACEIVPNSKAKLTTPTNQTEVVSFQWVVDARMAHINGGPMRVLQGAEELSSRHLNAASGTAFLVVGAGKAGADAVVQLSYAGFWENTI